MPWKPSDAADHTPLARNANTRNKWAAVANRVLRETGDVERALREANQALHKVKRRR